jgi:transcription initiation factor TFIID subunit 6
MSKGPNANSTLAAMSGSGNVAVKPLVKHVLSKELQLYFEKVCNAFLEESSEEYRTSAYSSLREDPGLHQLVPYFVQFISEKVTHGLKDIFVLTQVMHMAEALVQNKSLYVDPYVSSPGVSYSYERSNMRFLGRISCPSHSDLSDWPAAWRERRPVRTVYTP